ncbi:DUF2637 domain-containing protein [Micromonospora sp. CA-249363]|uniref:DUF2637 domain-containing protein n=1 Tax=Micromonospora sp. CA-249363 TaxID=3239963 RepID=UPI003D8CB0C9
MSTEKVENVARLLIVAVVGLAAGAASFTHVHDWTMSNSPAGTPGWFGWANAVISELLPVGSLLTLRHNRRTGKGIGFPIAVLIGSAGFSLAAQLAVAKPSASGWLLAAVPAIAFMLLVKMVLAGLPNASVADDQQATPLPVADQQDVPESTPVVPAQQPLPIADPKPVATPLPIGKSRKQRKPVVPAHPESAKTNVAEIVKRAESLKPELGTWPKVADALGISTRTLQNYRKAVPA